MPHAANPRSRNVRSDPWTLAGLLLLALLSAGVVAVYRSAPQSVAQAGARALLAARPDAYTPRMAEAQRWLREAARQAGQGRDSAAVAAYGRVVEEAERAAAVAETPGERAAAVDLWAAGLLGWAERVRAAAAGAGPRPDDREGLQRALALTERALAAALSPPTRARAEALRDRIRRELRVGPLEWLPLPR